MKYNLPIRQYANEPIKGIRISQTANSKPQTSNNNPQTNHKL